MNERGQMSEHGLVTIASGALKLAASPIGAEMHSVVCDGTERLWCADPSVWGRHAPLLFPLIGRLRDGYYELDGRRVDAPVHGFCRDRLFRVADRSDASVTFATSDDGETRTVYPFAFRLFVTYAVADRTVTKTLRVENAGDRPMPFEVGGHEAYATCLEPGETMADYSVRFEGADDLEMFAMDADGILGLPKIGVPLESGRLAKTPEQLGIDTIVLENVPESRVSLESAKSGRGVEVEFPDFPYLGIWTKPMGEKTRYLCLEPWSALPDAHFSPRELSRKPGVRTLEPGCAETLSCRMTFF